MRIANNVPALLTHINLRQNDRLMSTHMNRLSTGLRINSAREDAAGMAIANKLSFQLTGLERASDNSQHGISLIQTAEGALNEVHAMLQRIRELSVQAANDTLVPEDRMRIQREINDLTDEITALSGRSEFNTLKLLNGEAARVANSWVSDPRFAAAGNAVLTRVLANPLFISEGTPAGTLNYTVVSAGQPARLVSNQFDPIDMSALVPESVFARYTNDPARLIINGVVINVNRGDTMGIVWQRIVASSEYTGVVPTLPNLVAETPLHFTTTRNGSHERIELNGNADLWRQFGIYLPAESYARVASNVSDPPLDIEPPFYFGSGAYPNATPPGGTLTLTQALNRPRNPNFDPRLPISETNPPFATVDNTNPASPVLVPTFNAHWDLPPVVDDGPPVIRGMNGVITVHVGDELANGWPIHINEGMTRLDIFRAIEDAGNIITQRQYGILDPSTPGTGDYGVRAWEVLTDATGPRIVTYPQEGGRIWITADSVDSIRRDANGRPLEIDLIGTVFGTSVLQEREGLTSPSAQREPLVSIGQDVQIDVAGLFVNNDPNHPVSAFNDSMSVVTRGNRVTISSAQGHRIEMNIHVPDTYRRDANGDPIPLAVAVNEVTGTPAMWVVATPQRSITVNGVQIPEQLLHDMMTNPTDDNIAAVNELLNNASIAASSAAVAGSTLLPSTSARFDFDGGTWTLTAVPENSAYLITLGGSVELLQDMGVDPDYFLALEMELRIEEFGGLRVQIGPNYNMNMNIEIPRINSETLGLTEFRAGNMVRLVSVTTWEGAQRAIDQSDSAIQQISLIRSRLGAYQNRLEHTIRNLDNAALNTETARSRVQDTDMAREMTFLSKRQVMYQAGLAILGQANQRPQMILSLLQ